MFDTLLHRWLRVPYTLHVRFRQRPKSPKATILLIHGIGNTGDSWREVIEQVPSDIQVITIDLLGSGKSPKPGWVEYDARTHARSVLATVLQLRITSPITIVGHSLGALVAVEVARRYPLLVRSLILVAPPFYSPNGPDALSTFRQQPLDTMLRRLYTLLQKDPEQLVRLSAFAMKYNIMNASFDVNENNVAAFIATLRSSIVNQNTMSSALKLTVPTKIIRGTFDPFLVPRNLKYVAKHNPRVALRTVIGGHDIRDRIVASTVEEIRNGLGIKNPHAIITKKK